MKTRKDFTSKKRWIIKIGSALITADGKGLDQQALQKWIQQLAFLHQQGKEIILVSSGAVAEGMHRLGWINRPAELYKQQAAAAIGQMGLIQAYESYFQTFHIHTAQILLTHADLANRQSYLNARSTIKTLLELKAIPIINENDSVATEEIRFGDNDTLAALVANLVEADLLIILTDQQGLYTANPREDPNASLLSEVKAGDPQLETMASAKGGHLGRGGMYTKVKAAAKAARSGTATIIASGKIEDILLQLHQAKSLGTLFYPELERMTARKRWLAGQLHPAGKLYLDQGAVDKIRYSGSSLLPIGVIKVVGEFQRGSLVSCIAPDGIEIARGLVNYSSIESAKITQQPSHKLATILGTAVDEPEIIHRDNLVIL